MKVLKTQSKIRNATCYSNVEVLGFTCLQKHFWLCLITKFMLKCEWAKLQFRPMAEVAFVSEMKTRFFYSVLQAKGKTCLIDMEEMGIAYRRNRCLGHRFSWTHFQLLEKGWFSLHELSTFTVSCQLCTAAKDSLCCTDICLLSVTSPHNLDVLHMWDG